LIVGAEDLKRQATRTGDVAGASGHCLGDRGLLAAELNSTPTMTEPKRRIEEILEIAEILEEAADRLATVLERSGADRLHPPETLREMAHYELELAAADVAAYTFGTEIRGGWG
jgi:hypothetical protein